MEQIAARGFCSRESHGRYARRACSRDSIDSAGPSSERVAPKRLGVELPTETGDYDDPNRRSRWPEYATATARRGIGPFGVSIVDSKPPRPCARTVILGHSYARNLTQERLLFLSSVEAPSSLKSPSPTRWQ